MNTGSIGQPVFTFDSSDWGPEEAFTRWQEIIAVTHDVQLAASDGQAFRCRSSHWEFPEFMYGWAMFSPMDTKRDGTHIRRDQLDHYWLYAQGPGSGISQTNEANVRTTPGDLQFLDHAQPDRAIGSEGMGITLFLPRDTFDRDLPGLADLHGTLFHDERARQLCALLVSLPAILPSLPDDAVIGLANAVHDSLVDLLASRVLAGGPSERQMRPLRAAIEHYIHQHLDDPTLSIDTICATFDLSRATLYRLFTREEGVARYIRRKRLIAIHDRLRSGHDPRPLTDIAADFGFNHETTFRVNFREEFGYLPSEARREPSSSPAVHPSMQAIFTSFGKDRHDPT